MNRVVVAEDDREILGMLESTLKLRGYRVFPAVHGRQAWQLIEHEVPDAAILDLSMPGLDGLEVCRRVRADPRTRHIAVIFLTAHEELEARTAAYAAGADEYLVKPFAPREMTARLETLIKTAEARAAENASAAPAAHRPRARSQGPRRAGQVTAVFGAKGGVGASFLATNIAVALAARGEEVCLAELDVEHAYTASLLDLVPQPGRTLADLAMAFDSGVEWELVERCLLAHRSGVNVLPAPPSPAQAELITDEHVTYFLDLLRSHFAHIVVDLPSSFRGVTLGTFDVCDLLLLVITPDIPTLKLLRATTEILKRLGVAEGKWGVVLNRTGPTDGVPLDQLRRVVGLPLTATIPYGGEECTRTFNAGVPLLEKYPEHPTSKTIKALAASVAALAHPATKGATKPAMLPGMLRSLGPFSRENR